MSEPAEQLLQPDMSFEELYEQARESRSLLQDRADAILEHLREQNPEQFQNVRFEMGELKDIDRATGKIDGRYNGNPREITDLVRGRFVADTPEQIKALEEALQNDPEIQNIKNRFETPVTETGFRNISSETRLPNGHVAEIQVVQSDMLAVDHELHQRMERIQEIRRNAADEGRRPNKAEKREMSGLRQEMRDITSAAAHDAKLNDMVDPEIRDNFTYKGETVNGSALDHVAQRQNLDVPERNPIGTIEAKPPAVPDAPDLGKGKLSRVVDVLDGTGRRTGVLGGVVFGGLAAGVVLIGGGSTAQAGEIAAETAIPYGETIIEGAKGDTDAAIKAAVVETAGIGGAAAGAAIGTMIVPGLGTVIGLGVGYVVGESSGMIYDIASIKSETNALIEEMTAPALLSDDPIPDLDNFKQAYLSVNRFSDLLEEKNLIGAEFRDSDGKLLNFRDVDWSNPQNLAEFERMLDRAIAEMDEQRQNNNYWIQSGEADSKLHDAQITLKSLRNAQLEVQMFKDQMEVFSDPETRIATFKHLQHEANINLIENIQEATELSHAGLMQTALYDYIEAQNHILEQSEIWLEGEALTEVQDQSYLSIASAQWQLATMQTDPQQAQHHINEMMAAIERTSTGAEDVNAALAEIGLNEDQINRVQNILDNKITGHHPESDPAPAHAPQTAPIL